MGSGVGDWGSEKTRNGIDKRTNDRGDNGGPGDRTLELEMELELELDWVDDGELRVELDL